jgi:DNA (cytosine-5)-methyltransferase 1
MIAFDVFSGCGGLTAGLKRAGFSVIGSIESDADAVETYCLNHPEVKVWNEDIRTLSSNQLMRTLSIEQGELDLLAGCPPCQGFCELRTKRRSTSKNVMRDPQNSLLNNFLCLIEGFLPKAIMLENVPGLQKGKRISKFMNRIEELGYRGIHAILDVAAFGVPQRRRRFIMLASRQGDIDFANPTKHIVTVRKAIGRLPSPSESRDKLHSIPENRSDEVMQIIRHIPKDGGSRSSLPPSLVRKCHRLTDGYKDVYGRMAWDDVSPTITTNFYGPSRGRFLHPDQDRALTIREGAILQGFPRKYRFPIHQGKVKLARQIGNALPPLFIYQQAMAVRTHLVKNDKAARISREPSARGTAIQSARQNA